MRRVAAVVIAVVALLALAAPAAWAHVSLIGSDPADGSRIPTLPERIDFEFSADLTAPASLVVTGPDGESATDGAAEVSGRHVIQSLRGHAEGTYTAAIRATSADGHQVTAQVSFVVGTASGDDADGETPATDAVDAATDAESAPTTPARDSRRRGIALGVAAALFAASGALWWLSRRAPA